MSYFSFLQDNLTKLKIKNRRCTKSHKVQTMECSSAARQDFLIRTYAEEENCEAILRRSGSEFIILRIPKLCQKIGDFCTEIGDFGFGRLQETTFFFQKETKFFCFTTLIQLPMAHIKITFKKKIDRVPQLPAFNGSGY
jgi:hypothetical protein